MSARSVQRGEEFGGLGVVAGVVAAIGLGQRPLRIERSRLRPGEGGGIAGAGGRDRDLALHLAVGDEAPEAELERAVVAAEPFGDVGRIAAAPQIDAVGDVAALEPAVQGLNRAEALDRRAPAGLARHLVRPERGQPRGRIAAPRAQHVKLPHRDRGVAADDRVAAVEHVGEGRVLKLRLGGAHGSAARADAEALPDADRLGRRRGGDGGGGKSEEPFHHLGGSRSSQSPS